MGIEVALAGALIGTALLGSISEQQAIQKQADAEAEALRDQQRQVNERAAEERSDRIREADRKAASALVAFEALGGAGSQNLARAEAEIAGHAGLDLARINTNRRRQIAALQSEQRAVRDREVGALSASRSQFLNTALTTGLTTVGISQTRQANEARETAAAGDLSADLAAVRAPGG